MANERVVPWMALRIHSSKAQKSLLLSASKDTKEKLASNKHLDRQVWDMLAVKPSAAIASWLAHHPLDEAQIRKMMKEKRVTVRGQLFANGIVDCSPELAEEIIASPLFARNDAYHWLNAGTVPENVIKRVALHENMANLYKVMMREDLFTTEEVIEALKKVSLSNGYRALVQLMDARPEVVARIIETNVDVMIEAAAGSRHFSDRTQIDRIVDRLEEKTLRSYGARDIALTMLANPNVHNEAIDRIIVLVKQNPGSNQAFNRKRGYNDVTIYADALTRRSTRPYQGPLTTAWETTTGDDAERVRLCVKRLGVTRYPSLATWLGTTSAVPDRRPGTADVRPATPLGEIDLGTPGDFMKMNRETVQVVEDILDAHGENAWEIFWSLVPDWTSSLEALVNSSIELA